MGSGVERSISNGRGTDILARLAWTYLTFFALVTFVCSGFTASASWAMLAYFGMSEDIPGGPSPTRLLIKALAFSAVFAASIFWLAAMKNRKPSLPRPTDPDLGVWDQRAIAWYIAVVVLVALASCIRLQAHPHVEPDEAHHLIVARNLAFHGVYGSGMPATGYRPFDDYDSVGPTVIVPVAAAIWIFGNPLHSGRVVMSAFYVLLTIVTTLLLTRARPPQYGVAGAAFMVMAPGSLYLARTLYGEVPALAYLIAALVIWEHALSSRRPVPACVASGVLFGCALVTKYFLVVAVWPALGIWVFDRITHRRIKVAHALVPSCVAVCMLAAWVAVTSVFGPQGEDAASGHVSMYRSLLLFGLASVHTTLAWLAQHWTAASLYLGMGLLFAAGIAMSSDYRPAWLFLILFAVLTTYWWIFFTTGNIPRYLWYALAVGAMFAGYACAQGFDTFRTTAGTAPHWIRLTASTAVLVLAVWETTPRFAAMLTRDEMRDEYTLCAQLRHSYFHKKVATTFYPVERIANLIIQFPVARVRTTDSWQGYDAVIFDRISQPDAASRQTPSVVVGRYAIIEPGGATR